VLGEMGKETLLRLLHEHHSITPHTVGEDLKSLIERLKELLGSEAQLITKSIVKQMHSKMGIT
jgi:hypothetical protein